MIQHVWEAANRARKLDEIVVATENESIAQVVRGFGGKVVLTPVFSTGTDRVAHVAKDRDFELVVNVQGDEPLVSHEALDDLVTALAADESCQMATLAIRRREPEQLQDPNVVKVLVSADGIAMYFSRQPLATDLDGSFYKHVGIYGFRRDALQSFCQLAPSPLEKLERLEQLRALERGFRIRVVLTVHDTIAVDTAADLVRVEQYMEALAAASSRTEGNR